jgi:hypothetical protein
MGWIMILWPDKKELVILDNSVNQSNNCKRHDFILESNSHNFTINNSSHLFILEPNNHEFKLCPTV